MRYKTQERIKKALEINSKTKAALWFMLSLLLLLAGTHCFWLGFHNLDVAQNIEKMGNDMNQVLCDHNFEERFEFGETNLYGDRFTLADTYRLGLRQLIRGFYLTISGCILVGMFIGSLFVPEDKKK